MKRGQKYTEPETDRLQRLYGKVPAEELLAAFPGRTLQGLRLQALKLGMAKARAEIDWKPEEDALLRQYYPNNGPEALLKRLNRSLQGIKQRASRLGLTNQGAHRAAILRRPVRKTEHDPVPKSSNTLRPMQVDRLPNPVKLNPNTPNLNARKAARQRSEDSVRKGSVLEDIKRLPADSEGRRVYTLAARNGGPAADKAFRAWQAQQVA